MIQFSSCKINLGLQVLYRRTDGFHELDSLFVEVPWYDALEAVPANEDQWHFHGIPIPSALEDNLCFKAVSLFTDKVGAKVPYAYHVLKNLPMGAGLGGGSANAAHMLHLLNNLYSNPLDKSALLELAQKIGSDCSFFIEGGMARVRGRGEQIEMIMPKLKQKVYIQLLWPGYGISTAEAYRKVKPNASPTPLDELMEVPDRWANELKNDFEDALFPDYPELAKWKEYFYQKGAFYSAMSGSGSTIFGLFYENPKSIDNVPKGGMTYTTLLPAISAL
jgi:4-diphosphocytidyl-2-C-methyl-D-erythritol kinase